MSATKYKFKLLVIFGLLACLGLGNGVVAAAGKASPAKAATPSSSSTASSSASSGSLSNGITQSYNADPSVETGMIVELKAKDPKTVVPLTATDIKNMLGIVVPTANAAIVLTPQTVTQQQVLVATVGSYPLLVSNQNGPVKTGDYITVSAIAGVGMKANSGESEVVGKAAGDFSGTSGVIGSVKLKDQLGHQTSVSIGRIPVDLGIAHSPLFQKSSDQVPSFLSHVATGVANKSVSAARIYLGVALLCVTAFITANMMYSGVRSGMVAIGRNPLSKKSIIKSLIETVIAGLIVFAVGIFAVYLLLKL